MVFSSQSFIFFFLPISLVVYYISPKWLRNTVLLFFSFLFYASGEIKFLWVVFISILFNYLLALLISNFRKHSKQLLWLGILVNLSTLIYFKYVGFIIDTLNIQSDHFTNVILPLGISFYTFHSISYLVDIYRMKSLPQRNPFAMGLYMVNFSQLVAGPIIRYHDIEKQLNNRLHGLHRFQNGVKLFIYGLSKKILIANVVGEFADVCFNQTYGHISTSYAWLGAIAYALQIYFDFSGYSDMAIGIGRMFGFEFKQNFNLPYDAKSIREFWQKWHISLSSWFRDYVYIPLGGNRFGRIKTSINLMTIFVLCGFWHGANFTFLVWGLLHGFFIIVERVLPHGSKKGFLQRTLSHLYVWIVLLLSWVFFRAENIDSAGNYLHTMFSFNEEHAISPDLSSFTSPYFLTIMFLGFVISIGVFSKNLKRLLLNGKIKIAHYRIVETILLIVLFYLSIIQITTSHFNPFIYYRF